MAPIKNTTATTAGPTLLPLLARKSSTRRVTTTTQKIVEYVEPIQTRSKRKAEHSPIKNEKIKRSALGNLTNKGEVKITTTTTTITQMPTIKEACQLNRVTTRSASNKNVTKILDEVVTTVKLRTNEPCQAPQPPPAPVALPAPVLIKPKTKQMRRISNEFNKTDDDSIYMSALEDISSSESMRLSENFEAAKRRSLLLQQQDKIKTEDRSESGSDAADQTNQSLPAADPIPKDVVDFDKTSWSDPFQMSCYAMDIFNYLKSREPEFPISDYMKIQVYLTPWIRSLLVDWMVEVQETFELNHETLYLAVKIVDLFLCRMVIKKDKLQLLGAAALFIACKYDERMPPLVDDFLYICDGAYEQKQLVSMEITTLRIINYDLGIPLSYRFLRRYARCAKVPMVTLTLARYILELSLMDYATIRYSDSKLASAALFMALRMQGHSYPWTPTLQYYSGYQLAEFVEIVYVLNAGLHRKPHSAIKTVRNKYSHKIFHEVAKVNLLTSAQLFENNLNLPDSLNK